LAAAALSACRKSPAPASAATGTTGQAASSVTPPAGGPPPATPAAPAKPVPAQLPDLIARVNGEEIHKPELDQIIKTMEARAGQPVPQDRRDEIYRNAIDQLVIYKLIDCVAVNLVAAILRH